MKKGSRDRRIATLKSKLARCEKKLSFLSTDITIHLDRESTMVINNYTVEKIIRKDVYGRTELVGDEMWQRRTVECTKFEIHCRSGAPATEFEFAMELMVS